MTTIKKLDKEVVLHIAAGQVVEDPISIVKELVENSLDSQSKVIIIRLKDSGYNRIEVIDDGFGMDTEDVQLSYLPHTTSKITSLDDILDISSYGFRGEALASIAAVSSLTIESRQADAPSGWCVHVENGKLLESRPAGLSAGSRIVVENLFHAIPVRKNQTVSRAKQLKGIVRLMAAYSFIYPHVGFDLFNNDKHILHIPSSSNLETRIRLVHGAEHSGNIIPIKYEQNGIAIKGFIGLPELARAHQQQYIFINNRPVDNIEFRRIVKEAYGTLLNPYQYPFALLDITFPHEWVDINVDPQKRRIRMHDQAKTATLIHEILSESIQSLLGKGPDYQYTTGRLKIDPYTKDLLQDSTDPWSIQSIDSASVLQVNACYLLWESKNGFLIVDQHAAHERVLYEQYLDEVMKISDSAETYILSTPATLHLGAENMILLEQYFTILEALGFSWKPIDKESISLLAVPTYLKDRNYETLLHELIHEKVDAEAKAKSIDAITHATVTYIACRSAIKAGDILSQKQATKLIKKLFTCENPYTCPHGRPTVRNITDKELRIMFKRT